MAILQAENLRKKVPLDKGETEILRGVDLSVEKGEFISVMGPSGSGKTTLLYNLSGMDRMSSGSVAFLGRKLEELGNRDLSAMRLKEMGFIFQQIHLLKNLTIGDNISAPALLAKEKSRGEIARKRKELMERTGIAGLEGNDISQASGGQLQRAAICRALINDPEIIFGDEPTGALNSRSAGDIMDILCGINQSGTTVMLATHDVKVASRSKRVLFIRDGEIAGEFNNDTAKDREKELIGWLVDLGF